MNTDGDGEEEERPKNTKLASLIEKAKQVVSQSRSVSPSTTTANQPALQPRKKRLVKRAKKKSPNQSPKSTADQDQTSSSTDDDVPLSRRFSKETMKSSLKSRRMSLNTVVEKLKASSASSSTENSGTEQGRLSQLPQQVRMSSSAISSRMSEGSSSDCLNVDFSAAAIKKRVSRPLTDASFSKPHLPKRRVLERLADTPEFTQARKSSSSRSRRAVTGRAKRDAAREATESISRNIQDEKNKLIKPTTMQQQEQQQPAAVEPQQQQQQAKQTTKTLKSPKKTIKRKRARSKETAAKAEELQHGWTPMGDTFKRPILKPVCSHRYLTHSQRFL